MSSVPPWNFACFNQSSHLPNKFLSFLLRGGGGGGGVVELYLYFILFTVYRLAKQNLYNVIKYFLLAVPVGVF